MTGYSEWRRPGALQTLSAAARARATSGKPEWPDAVARCRATTTLARVQRGIVDGVLGVDAATDATADAWPSDYVEAFIHLGHAEKYGVETKAGLYGLLQI